MEAEAGDEVESAPTKGQNQPTVEDAVPNPTGFRPTRRVREAPGGKGSLGKAFWGDEAEPAQETFRPSRRCVPRENASGHSVLDGPLPQRPRKPRWQREWTRKSSNCHTSPQAHSLPSSSKVLGMEQGARIFRIFRICRDVDPQL